MAPMRDLICGVSEVPDCAMTRYPPVTKGRRKKLRQPRQLPCLVRQFGTPAWRDQPRKRIARLEKRPNGESSGFALCGRDRPLPEPRKFRGIRSSLPRAQVESGAALLSPLQLNQQCPLLYFI